MPVKKLTSLDEAEDACWGEPGTPDLWRRIGAVWSFSRTVAPQSFPPGVYKSRSMEEANARVAEWERQRAK